MYAIEQLGIWPADISPELRERVARIVAWEERHEAAWYPQPGRTLFAVDAELGVQIKVKGAGFFNPSGVSSAGTRRTTVPVPEGPAPMEPLQEAFRRDLIHVDPTNTYPHATESIHSLLAPIGGMTLATAKNDQLIFSKLTAAGLPCNRPLVVYAYRDLFLDEQQMGVSVAQLPPNPLRLTPHEIYLSWDASRVNAECLSFLTELSGDEGFALDNPRHRLKVLAKMSRIAGGLLLRFSTEAGLYRFSGSPDNWNVRFSLDSPLFFSDVDTSRDMDTIPQTQRPWEVLRNLISAIHQWVYYFLPCLTHPESGYSPLMLQDSATDFVRAMLTGFFQESNASVIENTTERIWQLLSVVLEAIDDQARIGLRGGEYLLQQHRCRPVFYFAMMLLLSDLIQGSELQSSFPSVDTSRTAIQRYVQESAAHPSHARLFPGYAEQLGDVMSVLLR